jgi:hypothetical protein
MWLSQLGEEAGVALHPSTREFTCIDVIRVWIAVFQRFTFVDGAFNGVVRR